jgi:FkbM family methyltransferase
MPKDMVDVRMLPIDDLGLERADLIKIDVEGMEIEVLTGAFKTIDKFVLSYISSGSRLGLTQ